MQAQISEQAGLLYLSGTIHRETSDQVTGLFNKLLEEGAPVIILSFQNVKALLSDGIRQMIALADTARRHKREFYITDLPREVKYTLQITNLLELLGHAGPTANLLQQKGISKDDLSTIAMQEASTAPESAAPVKPGLSPAPAEQPKQKAAAPAAASAPKAAPAQSAAATASATATKNPTDRLRAIGRREVAPAQKPAATASAASKSSKSLEQKILEAYIPGEVELQIVEMLLKSETEPVELSTMEYELDHEVLKIKEALRRLLRRETIDALGNGFFRMANKPKLIDKAKELCMKYHDKHTRYTLVHHLHQAAQLPK